MFDDRLNEVWLRGEARARTLSSAEIAALVQPRARRTGRGLGTLLATYAGMLVAAAALALSNLSLYASNPRMQGLELALAFFSAAGAWHALTLRGALARLTDPRRPLLESLAARLEFEERRLARWSHAAAFTPLLLSLAINTRIDAVDGRYPLGSPLEFAAVSCGMTVLTWFLLRRSLAAIRTETRALVSDLAAETLAATSILPDLQRRARREQLVSLVLITLGVLAGLGFWLANS